MEIGFHIGANCTDEDRLLKSLLKNASGFSEHNVKVPGPGKYRRLIRETIQNLDGAPPAPDTRTILLDAILDGEEPRRLVLSNSNFVCVPNRIFDNGIFYEQVETKVRTLISLFPHDEIDLYLSLRDPATFLPDAYKDSKAATLDAYLKGFHPTHIRWSDVVRRIRHVAPNVELTVWCNEDTPMIWAELIREISGVSSDTRITGGFDLLASIMSPEGMNRFLNYMRQHPPQTEDQKRRIIAAFLDKYAIEDVIEETVDVPGLTGDMLDDLSEIYDADVEMIKQIEGVNFIAP